MQNDLTLIDIIEVAKLQMRIIKQIQVFILRIDLKSNFKELYVCNISV